MKKNHKSFIFVANFQNLIFTLSIIILKGKADQSEVKYYFNHKRERFIVNIDKLIDHYLKIS
jgi:hypothetical protein